MAPSITPERPAKTGRKNRNAFVRTKVSVTERVISISIVILLAGIGIAIGIKGRHFNPDLYSLRTDALKSTAESVEGKAGTLRTTGGIQPGEESTVKTPSQVAPSPAAEKTPAASGGEMGEGEGGGEGTHSSAAPAVKAAKAEPMEINLPGIKPMGKTEFYNPDNLFEKIDGRAPAYLGFNFQALRSRSFSMDGAAGSYVDVYEYRMDTPVNAFGMFALERDPNGKPVDFAPDGYSGEMGFFFRQGAYYIQIMASDQNAKTLAAAKEIAVDRAKSIPADNTGLDARRRLPAAGMIPDSVTYVQENAQGQEFLKSVFQATYQFEGKKLPFFVMVTMPQAAADAWKSYQTFSGKFGKSTVLAEIKGAQIFQAENFGKCKVIYQREGEIGGVVDAEDAATARKFVEQYLQGEIR